ncbi:mannosyltransferase putative-domain-containing protein [Chytriomyces sp. MP71]|nr:mannosyltransferase putative-domain-containing protein [Chytriomyces sp. MP71]
MARRARALHILLRVAMREVSPAVLAHKESRKALSAMQAFAHVEGTVAKLTRSLYPWLYPTYKSIQEMYINTLKGSDEWGIVTTGGGKHFYMMQHLIVSLREIFQIDAPIQVFYGGAKDLDPAQVRVLESYEGVTTHNALNYFPYETRQWGQWSLKPFSMLASSFRRVLFIDADVLFFQDPIRAVLQHPAFKETRQVFFRDRKIYDERFIGGSELFRDMNKYKSRYAKTLGYSRAYEDMTGETHQMESGVIAMDKGDFGVLMGLLLAAKMNSKDERDDMLYALTWGDKEAFWFATEALRIPYRFNEAYGGCLGESGKLKDPALDRNTTCGPGLLQVDHKLQPLFFNGGFLRDRYAEPEKAEFIPYDRIGTDVRGDVRWVGGGCLHGKEDNVRPTNEKEKRIFKDLERLFKNLTVV